MRSWTSLLLLTLLLAACAEPPQRARIDAVRHVPGLAGQVLEVDQHLELSAAMQDALEHGIALRLRYRIETCGRRHQQALWLQYLPLERRYRIRAEGGAGSRDFTRLTALLAALDRVRLPLESAGDAACAGRVAVQLDPAALPVPLRWPALLAAADWQLDSGWFAWAAP